MVIITVMHEKLQLVM